MSNLKLSSKRIQINKANVRVVAVVAAAVFITVFSLVAVKALWSQRGYQARVIEARTEARDQLEKNIAEAESLTQSYQGWVSEQQNVIGGSSTGSGERDGDNARIVLDALPSKYDFPALTTSIEKLVSSQNLSIESVTGTDDEVNQAANADNPQPTPVEMPITFTVKGGYDNVKNLVNVLEKSIRPFHANSIKLQAGTTGDVSLTFEGKSYFQPEKSLQLKSEVVK